MQHGALVLAVGLSPLTSFEDHQTMSLSYPHSLLTILTSSLFLLFFSPKIKASAKASSTSTLYLTSTIAVPNNDETILAVSTVLQCQMLDDPKAIKAYLGKVGPSFDMFNDDNHMPRSKQKAVGRAPVVEEIYKFMSSIFEIAQFSPECNVIALVYLQRLMAFSGIALMSKNWRPLLLSSLLLAQKVGSSLICLDLASLSPLSSSLSRSVM
jgi:hypothetical protein